MNRNESNINTSVYNSNRLRNGIDNLKEKYPMVNFLRLDKNGGPAAARNFAIKNTNSKF